MTNTSTTPAPRHFDIQFRNPAATDGAPGRSRWLRSWGIDAADAQATFEANYPTCVVISVQHFACG